jgi:NAD(P)-dependent dehydrogenase (short-subunit alcohol dehydrogenase family)
MTARSGADGRVVVVTGAASGQGRACALLLARSGWLVGALDRDRPGLERLREEIERGGGRCLDVTVDVSSEGQVVDGMRRIRDELGEAYALLAAASAYPVARIPLADVTHDDLARLFAINVFGVVTCAREAAAQMRAAGRGGRIVLWSSTGARVSGVGHLAYCASKAAVESLVRGLAAELGPDRITVNGIAPGVVDTPMIAGTDFEALESLLPVRRVGTPDDVAQLAEYLCSDGAGYVTGATMLVDGGFCALHALHTAAAVRATQETAGGALFDRR